MVLIVLIVLWSIVLIPPAWQSHAEARRARQVDAFRRKLAVLAPGPDTPLARRPMDAARPFEAARAHVAVMAPRNVLRLRPAGAEAEPVEYTFSSGDTPGPPGDEIVAAAAAEAAARRADRDRARVDVLRRRQQVLMALMGASVVSLATAFVVKSPLAWAAHGLVVTGFAAYLAGLRRLKKLAAERRTKVRYFPSAAPAPSRAAAAPAEARRVGSAAR